MVSLNLGPTAGLRGSVRRRRPQVMSQRALRSERRRGLAILQEEEADAPASAPLPSSRSECRGGMRPCPFVSCRFHLYLDVNPQTGSIKLNFPDKEPWELDCSCALDVAEASALEGGLTLDTIGSLLNMTRERARQLEHQALAKILGSLDDK